MMKHVSRFTRPALQGLWRAKKSLRDTVHKTAPEEVGIEGKHDSSRNVAVFKRAKAFFDENAGVRPAADEGRMPSIQIRTGGAGVAPHATRGAVMLCPVLRDRATGAANGGVNLSCEQVGLGDRERAVSLGMDAALADDSPGGRAHQSGGAPNSGGTLRGVARK